MTPTMHSKLASREISISVQAATGLQWAAIAVGILLAVLLVGAACFCYIRRRREQRRLQNRSSQPHGEYPKRAKGVKSVDLGSESREALEADGERSSWWRKSLLRGRGSVDEQPDGEDEKFLPSQKQLEAGVYPSSSMRTNALSASTVRAPHYLKQQHAEIEKLYAAQERDEDDSDSETVTLEPPPKYARNLSVAGHHPNPQASENSGSSQDALARAPTYRAVPPAVPVAGPSIPPQTRSSSLSSLYSPSLYSQPSAAPSVVGLPLSTNSFTNAATTPNSASPSPATSDVPSLPTLPTRRKTFARYAYEGPIELALQQAEAELEQETGTSLNRADTRKVAKLLKGRASRRPVDIQTPTSGETATGETATGETATGESDIADLGKDGQVLLERTVSRIERDGSIRSYHTQKSTKTSWESGRDGKSGGGKSWDAADVPPVPPMPVVPPMPARRVQELRIVTDPDTLKNKTRS